MFRVFIKVIWGQMFNMKVGGKENKWAGPLIWGFVAVSLAPTAWLFYYMLNNLYDAFALINQLSLAVGLTLNIGSLVIFMLSLLTAPAIFYFSKDVEYILPLPVKPVQIISAKFAVALVFEYMLAVLLVGVMFAALWGHVGVGVLTLNMVLIALTLPILPLVYSTVIIMLLMRFVRFIRNPDKYNWVVGLFGLGTAVVFMVYSQGNMFSLDETALIAMLEGEPVAMTVLNAVFLSNHFSALAIGASVSLFDGHRLLFAGYQLFNVVSVLAGLCLFFLLARVLYLKGVLGLGESGDSGKKMTREDILANTTGQSIFRAYLMKELRVLFRSPVAFMNCVLMVLFMPIILAVSIVPIFTIGSEDGTMELLRSIDLTDPRTAAIALVGMAVLALTMSGAATITASAISREGRNFFVMKYLPVRYRTQLNAKAACGLVVIGVGLVLVFIPLVIIFKPPVLLVIGAVLVTIPCAVFLNYLGLFFDLMKPKLEWDNEAEAIKQNINIMLMIFFGMAVAAGVGIAGYFLMHTPLVAFLTLFGGGVILTAFVLYLTLVKGGELLKRLH
jgi:ABC-2 type transport system permease protein